MLYVTESDGEERIKTIAKIHEELSEVDLPLSDVENDDMTESEDNEEESEDKSNQDGAHGRPRFFRVRTQNRIVKDIACALDESNYDLLVIPSESGSNRAAKEKNTTKRFFGLTRSPVCLESHAGRILLQIVEESNQNTEIMIQLMKLGVCFLMMILSNTFLSALINVSVKKLLQSVTKYLRLTLVFK